MPKISTGLGNATGGRGGRRGRLRAWQGALVLGWVLVSLAWSCWVVTSSFDRGMNRRLADRAERLRDLLRDHLPPAAIGPGGTLDAAVEDIALRGQMQLERRRDPNLRYIVLWNLSGRVIVSEPVVEGTMPKTWPVPAPGEVVHVGPVDATLGGKGWGNVRDATCTLALRGTPAGYVSVGVSEGWVQDEFRATQWPLLVFTGIFTLLGAIVVLGGTIWARQRVERERTRQEQIARARTSLLTERGMLASVLAHEVRSPLTALRFNLHSLRNLLGGIDAATRRRPPSDDAASVRPADTEATGDVVDCSGDGTPAVAADEPAKDRRVELADLCEREIRRLDLMLSDFLTRTQVVNAAEKTSVNQVVSEALDFLRPALERSHVRVITHLDSPAPVVAVNADELRQVLLNLAANAQEAMPKGGTLAISTVGEEAAVTLLVRDSGGGIAPELLDRVFEPFFTTKAGGSGLGLALVRRVISGAGGTIFCESTPGAGTTFRIVLPRADEAPAVRQSDQEQEPATVEQ